MLAATIAVAVGTIVLAILTGVYVRLTNRILQAQTDPHVVVYAVDDRDRPTLIEIVIENVGRTVAEDVRFELSEPLVWAAGVTPANRPTEIRPIDTGPLVTGIPSLGPGVKRRIVWGQYGGLRHLLGDRAVTVKTRFKRGQRELEAVTCLLDVQSFAGTDASRPPSVRLVDEIHRAAVAIERIERAASSLAAAARGASSPNTPSARDNAPES